MVLRWDWSRQKDFDLVAMSELLRQKVLQRVEKMGS